MSTTPSISALLEHEDFVRRLALSLAADPAFADDLAQDTWLAALRRPPETLASVRSWLARVMHNQAKNQVRADHRRRRREAAAARPETDASGAEARERLALQHRVVEAVFALHEPHRSVVLLRYYDGLSSAEIARRRGVPAATVRSQLKRGLDALRGQLDREVPGGRTAWTTLLLRFAGRAPGAVGGGAKIAAAAVALLAAGAVAVPAAAWSTASPPHIATVASLQLAPTSPGPATAPAAANPSRSQPAAGEQEAQDPIERKTPIELTALAEHVQALLRQRMLTPAPEHVDPVLQGLRGTAGTHGAARVLRREIWDAAVNPPLGIPGGGAYFSFHRQSHSYGDEPDVSLSIGRFSSGFYGGSRGYLLDLGSTPLAAVTTLAEQEGDAQAAPELNAQWRHLSADAGTTDSGHDDAYDREAERLGLRDNVVARTGRTYLLRALLDREHDVLVAFRSVHEDQDGHTLVWRVLKTFGSYGDGSTSAPPATRGKAPAWLRRKTSEQLMKTLDEIRTRGEEALLEVPHQLARRFRAFARRHGQGLCRLLHRGKWDAITHSQGGGAFFSFVTERHHYQHQPDILLEQGVYRSGFAGLNRGFVLDLGDIRLEHADRMPPSLDEAGRRAWRFLQDMVPERTDYGFKVSDDDHQTAYTMGLTRAPRGVAGHCYLLRSVCTEHDVTVVFETLGVDDAGHTLRWRILKQQ